MNSSRWKDPVIRVATGVIAAAAIVGGIISYYQWQANLQAIEVARNAFLFAQRPYVGPQDSKVLRNDKAKTLRIEVGLRNFGPVPASEVQVRFRVYINGIEQVYSAETPYKSFVLLPGVRKAVDYYVPALQFPAYVDPKNEVRFITEISYKGLDERSFSFKQINQYSPRSNRLAFVDADGT